MPVLSCSAVREGLAKGRAGRKSTNLCRGCTGAVADNGAFTGRYACHLGRRTDPAAMQHITAMYVQDPATPACKETLDQKGRARMMSGRDLLGRLLDDPSSFHAI